MHVSFLIFLANGSRHYLVMSTGLLTAMRRPTQIRVYWFVIHLSFLLFHCLGDDVDNEFMTIVYYI